MTTFAGVIMARTQSTRVPEKAIRNFGNTTLIDIALSKLSKMSFLDYRYLAVAEDVLASKAEKFSNIEVLWRRPESVTKGDVPFDIRSEHYTRINTDYIVIINSCHPFLSVETIKKAVDKVRENHYNSYTSVIETVDWIFTQDGLPITNKNPNIVSTTETPKYFKVAHAFHIIRPQFLKDKNMLWTFQKHDPHLIPIPEIEAIDIDNELEFDIAESLFITGKCE